jgi:hypothetical protein
MKLILKLALSDDNLVGRLLQFGVEVKRVGEYLWLYHQGIIIIIIIGSTARGGPWPPLEVS